MKEIILWQFVQNELEGKNNVVLASVVSHQKGSPGKDLKWQYLHPAKLMVL
mgnify:CR=1 FL=1